MSGCSSSFCCCCYKFWYVCIVYLCVQHRTLNSYFIVEIFCHGNPGCIQTHPEIPGLASTNYLIMKNITNVDKNFCSNQHKSRSRLLIIYSAEMETSPGYYNLHTIIKKINLSITSVSHVFCIFSPPLAARTVLDIYLFIFLLKISQN